MENPLISVIIPIYKVEEYLQRCIDSVVNQTYKNLEIILVDDGSPDRCPQLCDEWAAIDSRIQVIHKSNEGLSSARNIGLDICNGEYICFIDSDDWVATDMVEVLLNQCKTFQVQMTVCGRYDVFDGKHTQFIANTPCKNEIIDVRTAVSQMLLGQGIDSSSCGKLFHYSLWKNIRFPFGKLYEDIAILYKVVLQSNNVALVSRPLYYYYRHDQSITTAAFTKALLDYPDNTRAMVQELKKTHQNLYECACWAHTKAIECVLSRLSKADKAIYKQYIVTFKQLSRELYSYRTIWWSSTVFSRKDVIFCIIHSCWYILRPLYQFNLLLKKLRRS